MQGICSQPLGVFGVQLAGTSSHLFSQTDAPRILIMFKVRKILHACYCDVVNLLPYMPRAERDSDCLETIT